MVQSQSSCHGGSTFGGATNSMSGVESDTFVETLSISPHRLVICFLPIYIHLHPLQLKEGQKGSAQLL